jgi:hypothetical protein
MEGKKLLERPIKNYDGLVDGRRKKTRIITKKSKEKHRINTNGVVRILDLPIRQNTKGEDQK